MKEEITMPKTERENKIWRTGYDMGVKAIMKENDQAIKIGRAIISVMDDKYEFKKEDY